MEKNLFFFKNETTLYMVFIKHKKACLSEENPVAVLEDLKRKSKTLFGMIVLNIPTVNNQIDKRVLMYGISSPVSYYSLHEYSFSENELLTPQIWKYDDLMSFSWVVYNGD